jgi:hypothetical protein
MTIVDAQGTGGSSPAYIPRPGSYAIDGSDYMTDPVDVWVHDESMESLNMVNMIMCSMGHTRFDHSAVFNKGPYTALVGCEEGREDRNASAGQVEFDEFTVNSSRVAGQPHIVKFWFDETDSHGGGPSVAMRFYGKVTIYESPSSARPFGRFTMSWKQLLTTDDPVTGTPQMTGSLSTVDRTDGKVEFVLFNVRGDVNAPVGVGEEAFRMRGRVVTNAAFTEGQAYTESRMAYNPGSGTVTQGSEFFIQFNKRYLASKRVGSSTVVKVYDRNSYTTSGFNYGVYRESTEERVRSTSGFSLETATGEHGFVGYHGMWFQRGVTLTTGQTLIRRSRSNGATTNYTAFIAPGKLEKQTRSNSTLGNMKNEEFVIWDPVSTTDIKVVWTGSAFNKVATFNLGTGTWTRITPTSAAPMFSANDWVHMHSSARGAVQFTWPSGSLIDSTPVVIWSHSIVNGDSPELQSGDLTLYGYFNMLKSGITSAQANYNLETPYFPDANSVGQGKTYVFKKSTLTLQLSGVDVALANGVSVNAGPRMNGLDCGPLVTTALTNLSQMPSQTTTYNWRTGSNNWNRFQTVKDANGAFVTFAQPLRFNYTHTEPGNPNDGKAFTLELEGDELHGIPFDEVVGTGRWYPGFTIPRGSVLVDSQGTRYLVKMIEGEQRMNPVADPNAVIAFEGFDLNVTLTPPTSRYVDPAIGARPVVTTAPKFIEGVLQN